MKFSLDEKNITVFKSFNMLIVLHSRATEKTRWERLIRQFLGFPRFKRKIYAPLKVRNDEYRNKFLINYQLETSSSLESSVGEGFDTIDLFRITLNFRNEQHTLAPLEARQNLSGRFKSNEEINEVTFWYLKRKVSLLILRTNETEPFKEILLKLSIMKSLYSKKLVEVVSCSIKIFFSVLFFLLILPNTIVLHSKSVT